MNNIDQIKALLKSGDIAEAEAMCRTHHAGRDVSMERQHTAAPWARPYRRVASRRSKVISLWALLFVAFLAPLAARADIAMMPPSYADYLRSISSPSGDAVDAGAMWCISIGCSAILGFVGLFFAYFFSKRRKSAGVRVSVAVAVLSAVAFICLPRVYSHMAEEELKNDAISVRGRSYDKRLDTRKKRREYDAYCLAAYREWSYPRDYPMPREDAPQEIWAAFREAERKWYRSKAAQRNSYLDFKGASAAE